MVTYGNHQMSITVLFNNNKKLEVLMWIEFMSSKLGTHRHLVILANMNPK